LDHSAFGHRHHPGRYRSARSLQNMMALETRF
jgi:hypothetical protein